MDTIERIAFAIVFGGLGLSNLISVQKILQGQSRWWWPLSSWRGKQIPYVKIPFGVTGLLWGIAVLLPDHWLRLTVVYIGIGCGLVAGIFWIIRPRFLTPWWLRWLEEYHQDILLDIKRAVSEIGIENWIAQTSSQADLERWVEDFRRERRL